MLELQYIQAVRNETPLSVAFIDIDRFKSINDQFGHEAGDSTLLQLISYLTPRLRRGDMLVRWGGEEFLLIFPGTSKEQALFAIKRLTEEGLGTRPDGQPLTASIGIAERQEVDSEDWRSLVDRADQRMYAAKQGGRNRIIGND
jgi:diguanylate cyclase (GGDEF)-like protein